VRVSLRPVRRVERGAVRHLVQLYIYDLGGDRWDVAADGTFGSPAWHRRFWARRGKQHFILLVAGRLRARQRSRTLRWRRRARDQRILGAAQVSSSRRGHASCADALQTLPGPVGAGRTHVECCGTALLASLDQALRDRGGRGAPTPPWRPRLLCAALRDGQVICVEGAAFLGSWEMISRVKLSALPLPASRAPSPPPRDPPRRGPRPGRRRRVAPPGR
jgi:hypothetical protein